MHSPGETLSQFRLVERIGGGASGEVWKASDEKLGRELAIRILPPEVQRDQLERLRRLAEVLEAANHHGIVAIESVGEADGVLFICSPLVDGTDATTNAAMVELLRSLVVLSVRGSSTIKSYQQSWRVGDATP